VAAARKTGATGGFSAHRPFLQQTAFAQGTELLPLVTVAGVRSIGAAGAPGMVRLRGVVTAASGWKNSFFLQDRIGGISADQKAQSQFVPGVQVGNEEEVIGEVRPGLFAPMLPGQTVFKARLGRDPGKIGVTQRDSFRTPTAGRSQGLRRQCAVISAARLRLSSVGRASVFRRDADPCIQHFS
jgi:hypothetical protein